MRTRNTAARFVAQLIFRRSSLRSIGRHAVSRKGLPFRSETFQVGLAVACVGSLQLMGCIRGPRNEVAGDLRDEAKKAAIQAQEELEARHREAAIARSADETGTGSVAAASKEPQTAPSARPRSPLAEYLMRGRTDTSSEDPFVQQASASSASVETAPSGRSEAVSQADAEWEALLEKKLALARSRHEQHPMQETVSQVSRTISSTSEKSAASPSEPAVKARPFPSLANSRQNPLAESASTTAAAGVAHATEPTFELPGENTLQDEMLTSAPKWLQQSSAPEVDASASAEEPVSTTELTSSQQQNPATDVGKTLPRIEPQGSRPNLAAAPPQPTATEQKPLLDPGAEAARVRVQVLLELAHSQYNRGDLHAAYRSALLAHQTSQKENVAFASGEELPGQFAEAIARELWGSPLNSSTPSKSAAAEATQPASGHPEISPAATPAATTSADATPQVTEDRFATVFGGQQSAGWQSISQQLPVKQESPTGTQRVYHVPTGKGSGTSDRLPGEHRSHDRRSQPQADPSAESSRLERTTTADWETRASGSRSDSVVWARVETTAPGNEWASQRPSEAPQVPSLEDTPDQLAAVPAPPTDPLAGWIKPSAAVDMQAPVPPETLPPALNGLGGESTAHNTSTQEAAPTETGGASNHGVGLLWAIVGFIAAAGSTMIGLRIQRSRKEPTDDPHDASAATLPLTRAGAGESSDKETYRAA